MIKTCGLYTIKDEYFSRFDAAGKMMDNKYARRPYYCGIKADNGILWLIPLSSKVEKYSLAIKRYEDKCGDGNCIFYYIAKLKGKESAFLIGDVIPCVDEYIAKPFTIKGAPFVIEDRSDIKALRSKLVRFLALVRAGKLHPNVDILDIEKQLLR